MFALDLVDHHAITATCTVCGQVWFCFSVAGDIGEHYVMGEIPDSFHEAGYNFNLAKFNQEAEIHGRLHIIDGVWS